MIPLFIPSHFGEHYQVLAQGQVFVPSGELVTTTDAARFFSIITRELTIPAEQWRGVLMRLCISIPPNFFHAADIYHELVKLFQRRQLQLVKIPRLEQLPTIKAEEGWGYCFMQGPHRHPSLSYSPVAINSLQDAQAFLGQINISEKEISRLLPSTTINSTEHLAELLTNHSVLVYKIPVPTAAPPVKPVEFLPATAADRPVPLGPETKSSAPASSGEKKSTPKSSPQAVGEEPDILYATNSLKQTGSGTFTGSADELYDAIRASETDVSAIAANTGIKPKNIQKVKDHVFYNEHLLDRYVDYGIPAERARFDSDLTQANAWFRLENGTHTQADINWLKHEIAERWFELKHNSGYSAAHNAAENRWPGNPWGN